MKVYLTFAFMISQIIIKVADNSRAPRNINSQDTEKK